MVKVNLMDKTFWQQIVENDCAVPAGQTAAELTPQLLEILGSTDPELRDDVAYIVFARWIVRDEHYSPDDLRGLITILTDNLSWKIGEQDTESVLLRSFSALVLSLIAYYDVLKQFLDDDEVSALLDAAMEYLLAEEDLRGYVEGAGWIHATAHTADLLKFLARNPKTTGNDHRQILGAIFDKLSAPVTYIYVHDEDERLVLAVVDVLRRELVTLGDWKGWLDRFRTWKHVTVTGEAFVVTIHAPYQNCKTFLRSLYFTLSAIVERDEHPEIAPALLAEVLDVVRTYGMGTIYAG